MFFLNIVLIVALMAAMSVFLTRMTLKAMGKVGGETIYKLYQSAEFIHNTGLIPPFWREKAEKKLTSAQKLGSQEEKIHRMEQRVKLRYMKQLYKIMQFAERTSTIADEETRDTLVTSLKKTYEAWADMSLEEMTGSG